ncbi:shikimate 5-dehydrogenase [Patulibacter sp.]|uniref:shikimate 5-dehydrogenase n=1 Tax=Patulibacter sp. TaxID=1912859 RepID=UPI0027281F06|nr:shikimate 5-dehydrogenase [Patulibacter sp.]MDO9410004.1 shikimate 5-dehydrogenase [Patulibacter sp.]
MRPPLSKDTRLCLSLSGRPGTFGTRFHNHLYDALGLDYVYKAFTTTDLPAAIGGVRALGIRGCAVSMPFKEDVIELVDELDPSAAVIDSVNTIVNDDGRLSAYNTDFIAVATLLREHGVPTDAPVLLRGSGGMAKAVAFALREGGFGRGTVVARNEATGRPLAEGAGFGWAAEPPATDGAVLVNATPIGMSGGPESDDLPFPAATVDAAATVFDVVASPSETPLVRRARAAGVPVVTGAEVVALQAVEQFVLYTGVRPTDEQVAAAAAHAAG